MMITHFCRLKRMVTTAKTTATTIAISQTRTVHVHANAGQQSHGQTVAQRAGDDHHRDEVEEVGQSGEDDGDHHADDPTGHGRQKGVAQQRLDRLSAQTETEEEAPDGQQDQEEPVAHEVEHQTEDDADDTGACEGKK